MSTVVANANVTIRMIFYPHADRSVICFGASFACGPAQTYADSKLSAMPIAFHPHNG
ncbi:hypothetical protein ITX75_003148 [Salmonella enterica]|nr:hypothetical protein [Salmonella enterica]